jgi:hypothetical protein
MNKIIYKQKNKIALALLAISVVISGRVSSALSSTSNEPVTQEQGGTGASSSSSSLEVQPIVGRDQRINITMRNLNGNEFSLSLPAHATTYDLYRAAESQVNGGIGITSGGERIPNYLYPTNARRLIDLGITSDTRLGYVRMEHNSYQLHPDDTNTELDTASIEEAIYKIVIPRRLTQPYNTEPIKPIIYDPAFVECSSDGENWRRLGKDIKMNLRYVEDRNEPYVVATPAFVCDGGEPHYVKHLFIVDRFAFTCARLRSAVYAEYHCRVTNSGHECRSMDEYLNTEDFGPFEELKPLIPGAFGYGLGDCVRHDYPDFVRHHCSYALPPSHIYRVNTNDSNDLWNILSAYYISHEYTMEVVGLSPEHDQILRRLLQDIGITYDLEFHTLLLEKSNGSGGFWRSNELNPGEAQWLRLAFRDRMQPCSAAGRIYVRNNVGGQPACFVTLNPSPVLINA